MMTRMIASVVVLAWCAAWSCAGERALVGTITEIDEKKGEFTVRLLEQGKKNKEYTIGKDVPCLAGGKEVKGDDRAKVIQDKATVFLKIETKDGKEMVVEVRFLGGPKEKEEKPTGTN